jgi:hypothetical protein
VAGSAHPESEVGVVDWVEQALGASVLHPPEVVARLWAGYGKVVRWRVRNAPGESAILKQIRFPKMTTADVGHQRKVKSYEVERTFYERFASHSADRARTPELLGARQDEAGVWLLLEDLDARGFVGRARSGSGDIVRAGLGWLAAFHAAHFGRSPDGLWSEGSYWHLGTRMAEWHAIEGQLLYDHAANLDARLRKAKYRTIIHGDPKLENFCVTLGPEPSVAAVDFQYVGGGAGVRDVVYFIGSALPPRRVEHALPGVLNEYFRILREELSLRGVRPAEQEELEAEWRELVPVAWLDFYRFTLGWSPSWAESDLYAQALLRRFGRERGPGSARPDPD